MKKCFDSAKFIKIQSEKIKQKIQEHGGKLYLEFGGKIFDDLHASRVLPGYDPANKVKLLQGLKDITEIIFVISAVDIERNKIRADFGITYDMEVLRVVDNLRMYSLTVSAIVITLYDNQQTATTFANKLLQKGETVYFHKKTKGYPYDVKSIVSEEGLGANPYIKTTKPLIVVAAPGPGSGKLATCLSQLYHEYKHNIEAGYAKFETFPVWNIPLKHPLNLVYEAATADLKDENMIDTFHLAEYGEKTVNYNRDMKMFPVTKNILGKIMGESNAPKSPTDLSVNMVSCVITDDEGVKEASRQEIIRRYFRACCDYKRGNCEKDTPERIKQLMDELKIDTSIRKVTNLAIKKSLETNSPVMAIELKNGQIVYGRTKSFLSASAASILNALKACANIDDKIDLIPSEILEPILDLKKDILKIKDGVLNLKDVLMALSIASALYPKAKLALDKIKELNGIEAHASYIVNPSDDLTFKNLNINLTCEPQFLSKNLYEV